MNDAVRRVSDRLQRLATRVEDRFLPPRNFELLQLQPFASLTVTSDDGTIRNRAVADALEDDGMRGVFAVSPDLVGQPGMLSLNDLRKLRDAGHEIAYHGIDDRAFNRYASIDALIADCRRGIRALEVEGLMPSVVMYPHGIQGRSIRRAVASVFSAGFTTSFGENRGCINRYALRRVAFGAFAAAARSSSDWYIERLRQVTLDRSWLVLMLHPGADEAHIENNRHLTRLVQAARDFGVAPRTASEQLLRSEYPSDAQAGSSAILGK